MIMALHGLLIGDCSLFVLLYSLDDAVAQSDCRTDPAPGAKSEMRQIRVVAHKPCWYEGLGTVAIPVLVVVTLLSVHDHRCTFWKDSSAILDVADGGPWGGERGGREEA